MPDLPAALGLSRGAVEAIWREVKANAALLDACPRHLFVCEDAVPQLRSKFRCTNCRGTVDAAAARWYQRGVEDAS